MSGSTGGDYNFLVQPVKSGLEVASGWTELQRNRLSLQQQQAQQEWGNILAHNTGPDGVPDFRAAAAEAAHNTVAARGMMAGLTGSAALQNDQISQGNAMALNISRGAMTVMNDPSDGNVNQTFDMLTRLYPGQQQQLESERQKFLTLPPDQRRQLAYQHGVAGLDASGSLSRSPYGVTAPQDTGGGVQPATTTQASPWGGATMTPGRGGVGFTLTPAQLNTSVSRINPDTKQEETLPYWQASRQWYHIDVGQPSTAGGSLGNGRPPDALRRPGAAPPASTAPAPQPSAQPNATPIITKQSPAEVETQQKNASISTQKFQDESASDVSAQTQLAMLGNMRSNLSQFVSGSGADTTLDLKRAIQSWGPGIARTLGITPGEIASQEDFTKIANQIALAQQGANSDNRMNISVAANPHAGLSPEGADMIIRQLEGNATYLRARAKLAQSYGDKGNYPAFQQSIAALDPRVFQYDAMKPDQKATFYKSLDDKKAFQESYAKTKALLSGG